MRTPHLSALLAALCLAACANPDQLLQPNAQSKLRKRAVGHYVVERVTTRDLGTLPGDLVSAAAAVNDSGIAVGWSSGPNGTFAVRWLPSGAVQNLGALGGLGSQANGINLAGTIVGSANLLNGESRAFWWSGGVQYVVETDPNAADQYWATGINNAGEIIGCGFGSGSWYTSGPVNWTAGTHAMTYFLPNPVPNPCPNGINSSGAIVGYDQDMGQPYEWTAQTGEVWLATPNADGGYATSINDYGQATGQGFFPPPVYANHAILMTTSSYTDLGTLTPSDTTEGANALSSSGNGIDNWGIVVGQSQAWVHTGGIYQVGYTLTEAFVWWGEFGMDGLGFLPYRTLSASMASQANGTNPNPQYGNGVDSIFVAGQSFNAATNSTHAVLWTVVIEWSP